MLSEVETMRQGVEHPSGLVAENLTPYGLHCAPLSHNGPSFPRPRGESHVSFPYTVSTEKYDRLLIDAEQGVDLDEQ